MGVNSIQFYKRFPEEKACHEHSAAIKWENGYVCKKMWSCKLLYW